MLQTIGEAFGRISQRITPNPFAFAIILTVVVWLAGIALTDSRPLDMVGFWYEGFWDLLTFSMQMTVILVAGHALATSSQARSVIAWLSRLPNSSGQAILLIAGSAIITGFLNWGVGLVTGAVMAITVSASARERGIKLHFPLAAAAGYMGLLIFGNGFSSSAPLLSTTEGHFLEAEIGVIPLTDTILTPYNLLTVLIFLLAVPLLLCAMHPPPHRCREVDPDLVKAFQPDETKGAVPATATVTLAERVEKSRWVSLPVAFAGLGFVGWYLLAGRIALDLNSINFLLVMTGVVLYGNPVAYVKAVEGAVHTAAGVILQFPFYSGIMGMMALSGLVEVFAGAIVSVSTQATLPITSVVSAAVVNFFVPSAGGQWAVQGPILTEAARQLEVPIGQIVMAFAYGDQLTNMVHPFWAIPLLGITALEARDLLGYTAVAMIAAFVIFVFGITVLPALFLTF